MLLCLNERKQTDVLMVYYRLHCMDSWIEPFTQGLSVCRQRVRLITGVSLWWRPERPGVYGQLPPRVSVNIQTGYQTFSLNIKKGHIGYQIEFTCLGLSEILLEAHHFSSPSPGLCSWDAALDLHKQIDQGKFICVENIFCQVSYVVATLMISSIITKTKSKHLL